MEAIEIKLYRHKTYKEIYLIRNWQVCGGGSDTNWFSTTTRFYEAVDNSIRYDEDIEKEYSDKLYSYPENKAKAILTKEMDFDGYKGKLQKALMLPIADFELIKLVEK